MWIRLTLCKSCAGRHRSRAMDKDREEGKPAATHPIVQGLRETLREVAAQLTPDIAPATVYLPRGEGADETEKQ